MIRKAISTKVRFEVFKRDSFTCQYCGRSSPEVVLHLDHINPIAGGGDNDIMNLVTSCQACNSGKGARALDDKSVIAKQKAQLDELNARREQLEMMLAWREGLSDIDDLKIDAFNDVFSKTTSCDLNQVGRDKVRRWLKHNTLEVLLDGLEAALETYYKSGDEDPDENNRLAGEALGRVISVVRGKAKYADRPEMRDLFYIRGIIRNRCYCNDQKAIALLEEAYEAGIGIDELKSLALSTKSWTTWHRTMRFWIDGDEE